MKTNPEIQKERQNYIDWLRIFLILSVFLFHIGMIFNTWPWHIKNDVQYKGLLWYTMVFMGRWRMPLLFLLSGAGTYFALGKRSPGQYLGERFKRLVIPLVVGVFTLVPIQVYIEKSTQYSSLLSFYPHMFEGIYPSGNFSWHHLWFIAYLFVISLIISPFLGILRGIRFADFMKRVESFLCKPLSLNIFVLILILSQLLLRPFFEENTHDLVNDWASITYYIIFFLAGFILLPNRNITEAIRKYKYWYLAEAAVSSCIMFTLPYMVESEFVANMIWDISSFFVAWSCGMAAIGFSKQYLNIDSPARKYLSEAIYPFYLLHQPVIVVVGYLILRLDLLLVWEVVIIIAISFTTSITIYWFLVKPYNFMRIIFGMKRIKRVPETSAERSHFRKQNLYYHAAYPLEDKTKKQSISPSRILNYRN